MEIEFKTGVGFKILKIKKQNCCFQLFTDAQEISSVLEVHVSLQSLYSVRYMTNAGIFLCPRLDVDQISDMELLDNLINQG